MLVDCVKSCHCFLHPCGLWRCILPTVEVTNYQLGSPLEKEALVLSDHSAYEHSCLDNFDALDDELIRACTALLFAAI